MNIMKTNMLLLDNRIRKDDGDNTVTVDAPVPSTVQPQAGMKALMFQGMQNLMANPALAKEVGVMNDDTAENQTAKSYEASSNIAFQGKFSNAAYAVKDGANKIGRKFAQYIPAGMLMLSTLLPASLALTSCNDKEYISVPASKYENNVTVTVDLSAMTSLVGMMQSTLTQMLLQQQLSYEQFQKYMEQTTEWRNKMEQRFANIEAVLMDMGDNIIDVKNGIQESNALQKMVINLLVQNGMSLTQANLFLQTLINEVKDGNKTLAQAMAEIMEQLKLVNQNLDSIIANQDRDYALQQESYAILKDIKGDTKAMRAAAEFAANQLITINNSIIDGNKQVVSSINQLDGDMKAGIAYIAQTVGWSTSQVIAYMNKLGIDIKNSNAWNASMIIAAINYNTHVTEKGNQLLAEFKADFDAKAITAEEYAQKILEVVESINTQVGVLVADFNTYAENMEKAAKTAIKELRFGNMTAAQTNQLLVGVLMNQQKAFAMYNVMIQKLDKIDVDMNAGIDKLASDLGCSTEQLLGMMRWLGFSDAQTKAMSTAAIINAIRNASNKEIFVLGGKLNTIIDKLGNGNGENNLSQEEIDTIIALLESINQGVENNGTKLDELTDAVKELIATVESYAQAALEALNGQNDLLAKIKSEIRHLSSKVNLLINYAQNAEVQRALTLNEIHKMKNQIRQIVAKMDNLVTPQDLIAILDVQTKELIAKLNINPADYSTIEELLADIDAKMEYQAESNKLLLELLEAVKKLDKNDPDYNAKLDKIIELMENFKFECNCKCDCDNNTNIVHEGENILLS